MMETYHVAQLHNIISYYKIMDNLLSEYGVTFTEFENIVMSKSIA